MTKKIKLAILQCLLFLMLISSGVSAESIGPYSGKVVDNNTGEPIPDACVLLTWSIYNGNVNWSMVYTNTRGEYSIPGNFAGLFTSIARENLFIYAFGYEACILDMSSDRAYRFKTKGDVVRLSRTTAIFDHTLHYEKISYVLNPEPEKDSQDLHCISPLKIFLGLLYRAFHKKHHVRSIKFLAVKSNGLFHRLIPMMVPISIEDLRGLEKDVRDGNVSLLQLGEYCEWEKYKDIPYLPYEKGIIQPPKLPANLTELRNELAQALQHKHPFVRNAALRFIGCSEEPLFSSIVIPCLDDPAPLVRHNAATVLRTINAKESVEPLLKLVMEQNVPWPQPIIQQEALKSIRYFVCPESIIKEKRYESVPGIDPETEPRIVQALVQKVDDSYLKNDIINLIRICEHTDASTILMKNIRRRSD